MSEYVIRQRSVVADDCHILHLAEGADPATATVPAGKVLVPLALWQAQRESLRERAASGEVGVWLNAGEHPDELGDEAADLQHIGVHFPKFTDGRGYSTATLLRTRYRYTGELRAFGDVLRDQFNYLVRSGFDTLQPRSGRYTPAQLGEAIASIADFTAPYQASVQDPLPLFRRVDRAAQERPDAVQS